MTKPPAPTTDTDGMRVAAAARVATPWGAAAVVEQVRLPQQVADKRFSSVVELLENDRGERLVRFAYSTDGTSRRGPVTLRERDSMKQQRVKIKDLAEILLERIR